MPFYGWGLEGFLAGANQTPGGVYQIYESLLNAAGWRRLLADPWKFSSIACMAFFGIVTAYLVRSFQV